MAHSASVVGAAVALHDLRERRALDVGHEFRAVGEPVLVIELVAVLQHVELDGVEQREGLAELAVGVVLLEQTADDRVELGDVVRRRRC